jgi:hypothetical protein
MKISDQAENELLDFSQTDECKSLETKIFAEIPWTIQTTNQFTDFIQILHKMADLLTRPPKLMKKGDFKF